ncbi:citronellol/citronellal dehydrogenase [Constrictibacter sp. MBR-5]|jgi:citronellol/citronellal dehydrogenase|uniref:SDR family oxidoreductase n=1 Tax=Constrictibacter sp. MBR-5 TaxID=3156467 RepID=UPI0033925B03
MPKPQLVEPDTDAGPRPAPDLRGRTVLVTGSSRGVGAAIALRCAEAGANVVVTGKTSEPHGKLPGTIHSVAEECERRGGRALAVQLDLRDEKQIYAAAEQAAETFGGIDVVVNNASAQTFTKTPDTTPKQWDVMFDVNARGTFFTTQACLPYLQKSPNPHILTIAAPINLDPRWFAERLARTMSKYCMAMCVLGWAEEFAEAGIASNGLWPRHAVATMAVKVFSPDTYDACRRPDIMGDAAVAIVTRPSRECTGRFFLDDDVLREEGASEAEIEAYWMHPTKRSRPSSFLDYDSRYENFGPVR